MGRVRGRQEFCSGRLQGAVGTPVLGNRVEKSEGWRWRGRSHRDRRQDIETGPQQSQSREAVGWAWQGRGWGSRWGPSTPPALSSAGRSEVRGKPVCLRRERKAPLTSREGFLGEEAGDRPFPGKGRRQSGRGSCCICWMREEPKTGGPHGAPAPSVPSSLSGWVGSCEAHESLSFEGKKVPGGCGSSQREGGQAPRPDPPPPTPPSPRWSVPKGSRPLSAPAPTSTQLHQCAS